MPSALAINRQLLQTNRMLRLGYAVLAVVLVSGYVIAQDGVEPGATNDEPTAVVDINKVGHSQTIVGVDYPDGFAVVVGEDGTINVVHYDGTVIVPNRKIFSHVYQEEHGPRRPNRDIP